MGTIEIAGNELLISSHIITYGNAADSIVTGQMRDEIETMWNEPAATLFIDEKKYRVVFKVTGECIPLISDLEIYQNLNPKNNYFRIEEFAMGNISFVDGLGCNTGYFKLENLYKGSTTAAHEYGHTLGLDHPADLDIRGKGRPGIMYPRGTLVDPQFQYEPDKPAGTKGGTLYPIYRSVLQSDIDDLKLYAVKFKDGKAILGEFTNIWHPNHADLA